MVLTAIVALGAAASAVAQDNEEIAELRTLIDALRSDYDQRIAELEQRLEAAERAAAAAETPSTPSVAAQRTAATPQGGSVTVGNAFNPQISVILDGGYYHDDGSGNGNILVNKAAQPSLGGHGEAEHDHAHGADISNGFNLRETEIAFTAAVDPYFDAAVYLALESGGEVEIEEAWFATRNLPAGLRLKAGKFLSDIGYLNNQHPHVWDFVDQNLAYQNLLGGHGLQDTGLQLTWLPNLPIYTVFGAELLQGDQDRLTAFVGEDAERQTLGLRDRKDGPRLYSLFAKISPELGYDHALRLGASYIRGRQHQEIQEEPLFETGLEGDAQLWGIDVVYKYDNASAYGYRDFALQAEYLRSTKDLLVRAGDPAEIGNAREFTTDGMYIQGIYGVAPRWQFGLRYDTLGRTNEITGDIRESFGASDRWTSVLTWTPTEFSRLRLQYSRSDILTIDGVSESFDTIWLQWLLSMGTHGAHRF
jgi:hypothetical protein